MSISLLYLIYKVFLAITKTEIDTPAVGVEGGDQAPE
jgi:hypothetical protein